MFAVLLRLGAFLPEPGGGVPRGPETRMAPERAYVPARHSGSHRVSAQGYGTVTRLTVVRNGTPLCRREEWLSINPRGDAACTAARYRFSSAGERVQVSSNGALVLVCVCHAKLPSF